MKLSSRQIINKIKKSRLVGMGGAGFPTGLKWEIVKNAKANQKYIICNASEGEPDVFKDGYLLENYPQEVIEGIKIALSVFENSFAYIYLRKDYYQRFKNKLEKLIKGLPIVLFKETGGYLCGEETTLIESIEGQREEPRIRPPFPCRKGLFNCPTLINNAETFYYVAKVIENKYEQTRFYCLSGDLKKPGIYEMPLSFTIKKILEETGNFPEFDFFVQAGGGASGEILTSRELGRPVNGSGAIIVYNLKKTKPILLMKKWINFYFEQNCGK